MSSPPFPPVKSKRRRRWPRAPIPPELEAEIRTVADGLLERHGDLFSRDPRLKARVAAELRRRLPPQPGRRGYATVTAAIKLHHEIQRSHPQWASKQIWKQIYVALIPNWATLGATERRTEADQLHRQARWRLSARRRRARRRWQREKAELSDL